MDPQDPNTGGQNPTGDGSNDQPMPAPDDQGGSPMGGDSMPPAGSPTPEETPAAGSEPEMAPPTPATEDNSGNDGQAAA